MLEIKHHDIFERVVEDAKHRAGGDERWVHAIDRAAREILNNPFMHWQDASMLILSRSSNEIYEANGACGCKSFEFHRACWHRAAARVWQLYLEAAITHEWVTALGRPVTDFRSGTAGPSYGVTHVNDRRRAA
jgi:hypothetical protein